VVFFATTAVTRRNVIEQLKNGVNAAHASDDLLSNWLHGDAALGWNLKSWVRADGSRPQRGPQHCANGVQRFLHSFIPDPLV